MTNPSPLSQVPHSIAAPYREPTRAGVLAAAEKLAALVPQTPLLPIVLPSGQTVWAKAECLQPVGSFKIRGAWHRLSDMTAEERARGIVAVSSGNHAQGVAWAAKRLGIAARIVMPADAPAVKAEATRAMGSEVVPYDRATESRDAIAADLIAQSGAILVHAFGDPWVIEGQGSMGIELSAQMETWAGGTPTRIVCPCGGGGLASGLAIACPDAEVVPVEPEGWDDVVRSLDSGKIEAVAKDATATSCDALQTTQTYPMNFNIMKSHAMHGVTVTDTEVHAAQRLAFSALHLVVEPGGATALAALMAGKVPADGRTAVILSGGNVDPIAFARTISAEA
ncbi:pyridoxal-5'-phosphate-dependent enzyme, beta subunit [Novosphingobium nitrogenifigens DSM 19370]|uniref:Pyridoxal-5'-phosphate-dependent enzyme, beta subunit n=1 Tax=Novosphingobium nitrogenifigens DSM 19370 TaxID=983920 RepID=F1ZA70_9SPHN|nr:pyridoxal-phosphate dependent enzyme [Novosphingobium nitrogenifigens]EGD58522.1 pyridoxal-5'-phosphate-dependent enzyme, beta subunit [Novosphingobium nitrogenifigens DSM 19370]